MERVDLARLLVRQVGEVAPAEDREDRGVLVIAESDQRQFMRAFAAAVAAPHEVLLADPTWTNHERTQLTALLQTNRANRKSQMGRGWLGIPTGGSSGELRFARHDETTLAAAVAGFIRHWGVTRVNAVGVLPLHHVSGLLAWLRCVLTGGEYLPGEGKAMAAGDFPVLPERPEGWMISLVPTQLERLLRQPAAVVWLQAFRIIFVGGGPTRPELLEQAAAYGLPLSLGYGMTETAAMVTALRPEEFRAGARSCGKALPHAQVVVQVDGSIKLAGESLFRGYYPDWREEAWFVTADTGRIDSVGQLHVHGRRDDMIITGGEKVDPREIDAVLQASGEFSHWLVWGVPDAEWGQRVVVAYEATGPKPNMAVVTTLLTQRLAPAKRPKQFLPLAAWPVNAQGKVNRREVLRLVQDELGRMG